MAIREGCDVFLFFSCFLRHQKQINFSFRFQNIHDLFDDPYKPISRQESLDMSILVSVLEKLFQKKNFFSSSTGVPFPSSSLPLCRVFIFALFPARYSFAIITCYEHRGGIAISDKIVWHLRGKDIQLFSFFSSLVCLLFGEEGKKEPLGESPVLAILQGGLNRYLGFSLRVFVCFLVVMDNDARCHYVFVLYVLCMFLLIIRVRGILWS